MFGMSYRQLWLKRHDRHYLIYLLAASMRCQCLLRFLRHLSALPDTCFMFCTDRYYLHSLTPAWVDAANSSECGLGGTRSTRCSGMTWSWELELEVYRYHLTSKVLGKKYRISPGVTRRYPTSNEWLNNLDSRKSMVSDQNLNYREPNYSSRGRKIFLADPVWDALVL